MRLQGGRRTSPGAAPISMNPCPQCGFRLSSKNELQQHVQRVHGGHPNCPFCQVGFFTLDALEKHIQSNHNENQIRESVITKAKPKSLCIFNLQPRGCKKGLSCDFSHETGAQQKGFLKVPNNCGNGPDCAWKPGCRYVHTEDGETIPPRAPRVGGMETRANICHWSARDCPRGGPTSCSFVHRPEPANKGFLTANLSQPPPDFSLTQFPGLPAPKRPSVFRINPNHQ